MYGTAKINTSDQKKMLTIPASSLLGSGAERYVLVEVAATAKGHEFRKQSVVVASENSVVAQLGDGSLFPGDRVVSRGGQVLSSFFVLGSLRLSPEGIRNVGLQIEPVSEQLVSRVLTIDGMIDLPPGRIANVSSQVSGTLRRFLVDRNGKVEAGEVIAEVTSLEFLATQLELLKADREHQLLNDMLERFSGTGSEGIVPTKRLWEQETARNDALNRRKAQNQRLLSMGLHQEQVEEIVRTGQPWDTLPIRSPINGTVAKLNKVLGEQVGPDDSIFEIHDLSHVLAKGFLSEREAAFVKPGAPARVRLTADASLVAEGKVVRSTRQLSQANRTLVVWVELESGAVPTLQRNLLARISTTLGKPLSAVAVPISAIATDGSRKFVFVQKEDGLLERRNVETGQADDRFIVIQSGLNTGEMIAVQGAAELQTTYASVR
jgi:RND family efflux transporter MFP subunit